jgi:hypothetical protein
VQWKGQPTAEATWTDLAAFQETYPSFQLEDELLADGGEMSWWESNIPGGDAGSKALRTAATAATEAAHPSVRVSSIRFR